jgi:hypothetical protein
MSACRRLLGAMVVAALVGSAAFGRQGGGMGGGGTSPASEQETVEFWSSLPDETLKQIVEQTQKLAKEFRVDMELVARVGADGAEHQVVLLRGKDGRSNLEAVRQELLGQERNWKYERAYEQSRVTLDFPGGTVEEYVRAIGAKPKLPGPIFVSRELAQLRMRPIELRGLEFRKALALLSKLPPTNDAGQAVPLEASWVGEVAPASDAAQKLEDYRRAILIVAPVESAARKSDATRRAAFALGEESISKPALTTLFDAIAVATNMDGESKTFKAQYHEPSGLLIVRGTRDELGVVAQIVKAKFPKARTELPSFDPDPQDPAP